MIEMSGEIKEIAAALMQFQGMVDGVHKASNNPHFKSRYANLEKVVDTARPALQEVGLLFTQSSGDISDGNMQMTTMIIHASSGQWMRYTMWIPLGKKDPQGAGSAQTYAQRYSLMAALGLPPTDDDAETAIDRNNVRPEPTNPAIESLMAELSALSNERGLATFWNDNQGVIAAMEPETKRKFIAKKDELKSRFSKPDTVGDILNTFGGKVVNETLTREQSPLEAGE